MTEINANLLESKFNHILKKEEITDLYKEFNRLDDEQDGYITYEQVQIVLKKEFNEDVDVNFIKQGFEKLSIRTEGEARFEEVLALAKSIREEKMESKKIVLQGSGSGITHVINNDEKEQFVEHINLQLKDDPHIGNRFPIDEYSMDIFEQCKDGLILSKLINDSCPDTIDDRVLNYPKDGKPLSQFHITENNNVVINSCKAIGCNVVNIGSVDLAEGRPHLILGLLWQIIKIGLSAKIDIAVHPELFRLLMDGETLDDMLKLPTEQILVRWMNYHLKESQYGKKVTNLSTDIKDGVAYTYLLNQLDSSQCSLAPLNEKDLHKRAEMVLCNADKLGCRKYLTPKTLMNGNSKLNFAFVANLFNTHPCLAPLSDEERAQLDEWLFSSSGDRESRSFALWMNSLGCDPFVNNLFDDLQDGLVLLQTLDKVHPGLVDWKKVNKQTPITSKFKKVENTNYVIALAKSLNFSLVGIQGSDITDGIKNLTLGLVWQMMRDHIIQTLKSLKNNDKDITDADIIAWANETVKRGNRTSSMSNFKDPSLKSGVFLIDLLNGIRPKTVNYDIVTPGNTEEEQQSNAKYAISIARKLGASIFLLPEDIIEVKPKMIMTFCGTLMAIDHKPKHDN